MKTIKVLMAIALVLAVTFTPVFANGESEATSVAVKGTGNVATDPHVTLVYAEVNPLDTIVGKTDLYFKEQVEKLSGGSITIDIQPSAVLGSENDVMDSIIGGGVTIDMSRLSIASITSYGSKKNTLMTLPFMFESRKHFWNFAGSELAEEFLREPQEIGLPIRGIMYGEEGFRHFFTKKQVNSIEDLKGMKLRVASDPVMSGLVKGLQAAPTVVSFGELYSALQTGVVDGAEQPAANYKSNAFHEVAPYLILDGHTLGTIMIIISDNGWNKLTPDQQDVILEAAKLTQHYNASISEDAENKVLDSLRAAGIHVVEIKDKAPWVKAAETVTKANIKGYEDLYNKIQSYK